MIVRRSLAGLAAWARVWWHLRWARGDTGAFRGGRGLPGVVEDAAAGLWAHFDDAPERLSAPQSALLHAWAADGLIANGGMVALVESLGDRGEAVVGGFRALGLPEYADAVERALEFFPHAGGPDPDDRLADTAGWLPGGPEETELAELEEITFASGDVVPIKAAAFVADHPEDFPGAR